MAEIVVVGAGPAGLMAALEAAGRGHAVTVLEAAPVVGGMAGSFEVAGQRVDLGSHRLHPAAGPDLLDRLRSLLGSDLQTRPRNGRIRLQDRWIAFPLRPLDMVRSLPPGFSSRVAADTVARPFRARRLGGGAPDGFLGELHHRLGPTITDDFYAPYARKLYGVDPGGLSAELARRRVSAGSPWHIVGRAVGLGRGAGQGGGGRTFLYPRRGFGQMAEALAEAAVAAGVELRLDTPVTGVARRGDRMEVTGAAGLFGADLVLSSMALPDLVAVLEPAPGDRVVRAVSALRVRAMVLVYLVVDRPRYTAFDAHYLPGAEVSVSRLSEPKNYRDGDDPPDRTVLCAEVPCWVDDDRWRASPADLGALVVDDLARAGLPVPVVAGVEVRRLRSVYPVNETATDGARAEVDRFVRDLDGVVTFGRQGLGVPDNLHHVVAMGQAAARATVPGGGVDRARWHRDLDAFTRHVVQD